MFRIDGAYLYELGKTLQPLNLLEAKDSKRVDLYFQCLWAKQGVSNFLYESVFRESSRASAQAATKLLTELAIIAPPFGEDFDFNEAVDGWRISQFKSEFSKFEAVLIAELQNSALYYASAKGGYDTAALTDAGEAIFPADLSLKVPDAIPDVRAAARCIAFDLPTAAAFHLHRANEAVLRRYFDEVVGFKKRPSSNNMGDYLKILRETVGSDKKVLSVLQSIKDLHRNPIMHPEERLDTVEEAISLMAAIRASIGYMLDRILSPNPPVIAPLPLEEPATNAFASS